MSALQGPIFCPATRSKQGSMCTFPEDGPFWRDMTFRSGFWRSQGGCRGQIKVLSPRQQPWMLGTVTCSFTSSSNDNSSMVENDEDYVNSSVVDAVEVKSWPNWFFIRMRDGGLLSCVHNNPEAEHIHDYAPHLVIMLKMKDGSDLLLPIIVLEMPSVLRVAVVRDVPIVQPTSSQVMKEMIEKMGYYVKLVRVTKRVHGTHLAQLYVTKVGDETKSHCFDLRSSEAIDIAIRCKVPIQVNKHLVFSDGMRIKGEKELLQDMERLSKEITSLKQKPMNPVLMLFKKILGKYGHILVFLCYAVTASLGIRILKVSFKRLLGSS